MTSGVAGWCHCVVSLGPTVACLLLLRLCLSSVGFFSCIVFSYVIHMIGSVLGIHLEKSIVEIVLVIHCDL